MNVGSYRFIVKQYPASMKLLFIDETSDEKFKKYLGFCVAVVDAKAYSLIKRKTCEILDAISWQRNVEFKGAYLFSRTKGCTEVEIEKRIEAAGKLLDLNAKKNARMKFTFGRMESSSHGADYQTAVPALIKKLLPRAPKGAGKNLIAVIYDERSDLDADAFNDSVRQVVESKGYMLFERAFEGRSGFDTVGLMFADLVGYLAARIDVISNDAELFEGLTPEQMAKNGKLRKLESSSELIGKIKKLDLYHRS